MSACNCPRDWRLEILDLGSGTRLGWLPFLSFEFEEVLNEPGSATITCSPFNVSAGDVFPHLRAVAFTRTNGPGASPSLPFCEFIGMVETIQPDSDGNMQIGLLSIEEWLNYAIVETDKSYFLDQNNIGADLVTLASTQAGTHNIPLTATWTAGTHTLDQDYLASDDKVILAAITDLIKNVDGPSYFRTYSFSGGAWSTNLAFADTVGADRGKLEARRGLVAYSMAVDGSTHANWVRGRNDAGDVWTEDSLSTSPYPKFAKGVQWSDLQSEPILVKRVQGEIVNNFDPSVLPDVTIADLDIAAKYRAGDTLTLEMNSGALRYSGSARVFSRAWSVGSDDSPTLCTLALSPPPGETASILVLQAPPVPAINGCC